MITIELPLWLLYVGLVLLVLDVLGMAANLFMRYHMSRLQQLMLDMAREGTVKLVEKNDES